MFHDLTSSRPSDALPAERCVVPTRPSPGVLGLAPSAAGWHDGRSIQTLTGLAGTFQWYENPLRYARIGFTFYPGQQGSQGAYAIRGLFSTTEQGMFACTTQHPLIGLAAIGLYPSNGQPGRVLLISGLYSDAAWKIQMMLLNRLGNEGPVPPGFSAFRTA